MGKTVLKICSNSWNNASRDKRELSVYRELGADVAVLAKGERGDHGRIDNVDGFRVYRYSTRPLGERCPASVNRFISFFRWARFARRLNPDIISGHDLIPLTIGWLSTLGRKEKPKLIYDSHEFELELTDKRGKLEKAFVKNLEGFLMRRCVFSMMVNDCIADEVQKIHNLEDKPVVVRNTPNYWKIDQQVCRENKEKFLKGFEASDLDFIAMFHGNIVSGRGIEYIMKAVADCPNVGLLVLGNGEEKYLSTIKALARNCGIESRVQYHPAVPLQDLWKYVGAADVGMIAGPAVIKNFLYSLPNKFFENIQSMTPIICPSYPAMQELIEKYQIGLTCDPLDTKAMSSCIQQMRNDKEFYARCKENLKLAKEELCWEHEKQVLIRAFKEIG